METVRPEGPRWGCRDGHGLGPSMGWVGSHFPAHVMGWVGLNEKYCYFIHCILCLLCAEKICK